MINQLIDERALRLDAAAGSKDEVINLASELLAGIQEKGGPGKKEIYRLLTDREALGSTGIGDGIAIPHATVEGSGEFKLAIITIPGTVDFDSLDGKPVSVVFAMLGPAEQRSNHVRILASLSRLMKIPGFLGDIVKTTSVKDFRDLFQAAEDPDTPDVKTVAKSLLLAVVQRDEYLEPLLEILTGISQSETIVMEGHGAGRYLHALPLFSMFWTDESQKTESKVVIAVIDRHAGNETIRQISTGIADPSRESGLMVAIQDLSLVSGSLEI